ncbi:MAG: hypothetical protein B7Y58_06995 [Halothiobacillus sp. 35-54-62]|nr:MAG: hypothetical protein B7Y58_06995 [Halothiobacillus sp. 35-54-62]
MPRTWLPVCPLRELGAGERRVVEGPDTDILVVNTDGIILAVANQCSHQDRPLDEGALDGDLITCPYHNAQHCRRPPMNPSLALTLKSIMNTFMSPIARVNSTGEKP